MVVRRLAMNINYTTSVGELRFAPPQPPKAVEGIQDATTYGPSCPQSTESTLNLTALGISNIDTSSSNISISEDCG